jgi:DNA-binding NarL/FixJ family response regulator
MQHVLIVDDKILPREWARIALCNIGFEARNIHEAVCGDDAVKKYEELDSHGVHADFILSDYHMDPKHKQPEGTANSFRNAVICDGITLAKKFQEMAPSRPFYLHSRGMTNEILSDATQANIELILHKRRPNDTKFAAYCDVISAYLKGQLTRELYLAAFPKLKNYQTPEVMENKLRSMPFIEQKRV